MLINWVIVTGFDCLLLNVFKVDSSVTKENVFEDSWNGDAVAVFHLNTRDVIMQP